VSVRGELSVREGECGGVKCLILTVREGECGGVKCLILTVRLISVLSMSLCSLSITSSNSFCTDGFSQCSWAFTNAGHNRVTMSQFRFVTNERLFSPSTMYSAPYRHRWDVISLGTMYYTPCTHRWDAISLGTMYYTPYRHRWDAISLGTMYYTPYRHRWDVISLGTMYYTPYTQKHTQVGCNFTGNYVLHTLHTQAGCNFTGNYVIHTLQTQVGCNFTGNYVIHTLQTHRWDAISLGTMYYTPYTHTGGMQFHWELCITHSTDSRQRLFQCGSQEAGLVKYDKYACKKRAEGLGYNKNTRHKIHNKQLAI